MDAWALAWVDCRWYQRLEGDQWCRKDLVLGGVNGGVETEMQKSVDWVKNGRGMPLTGSLGINGSVIGTQRGSGQTNDQKTKTILVLFIASQNASRCQFHKNQIELAVTDFMRLRSDIA